MDEVDVARAFLRHDGEVLACRRSETAPAHAGRWDGVSVAVGESEDPAAAARRAIRERTGVEDATLARAGSPLDAAGSGDADAAAADAGADDVAADTDDATLDADADDDGRVVVRPFLFDVEDRAGALEDGPAPGHEAVEWTSPTAFLRRETVPGCWSSYERVAPTVQSVAADDERGAATLSIRALEVLRDRAGVLAAEGERDVAELDALGQRLRRARPSMAVLRNRVNRALATAGGADSDAADDADSAAGETDDGGEPAGDAAIAGRAVADADEVTPADVEAVAIEGLARALAADAEAAMRAAGRCADDHVLTLSRSSTVLDALAADTAAAVSVAESRPAREGVDVAEALAGAVDAPVSLHTDAAIAHVLASDDVDAVLVGADTVLPDGRVVNKTGTRGAAVAVARADVPVYVAAATDKVTTREDVNLESGDATAVYDGDADLDVRNPTFDVAPADAIDGIVTERGVLDPEDVGAVAEELRALEPA